MCGILGVISSLNLNNDSDVNWVENGLNILEHRGPDGKGVLCSNDQKILFCHRRLSIIEPWGVVVHEFASMRLPLLLSKNVGSSNEFLIEGFNGYSFNPKSSKEFITKLDSMMKLSSSELSELGFNSARLASRINTDIWSTTLFEISIRSLKISIN